MYQHIDTMPRLPFAVVAVGAFDGVHRGHVQLLRQARAYADTHGGQLVVLSFEPLPAELLYPSAESGGYKHLLSKAEKEDHLAALGVDSLLYYPFDEAFSQLSKEAFVKNILVEKLDIKAYVLGYNHRFAYARDGEFLALNKLGRAYGFKVLEVPLEDFRKQTVSSALIKKYVSQGQMRLANKFLGYRYSIAGVVVKGNQIGRQLGFPTANIDVKERYKNKLLPSGVYVAEVMIGQESHQGMLNIGYRPSIRLDEHELRAEVHIFNFDKEIYGQHITIYILEKLRDEERFVDIKNLVSQLKTDKAKSRQYFDHNTF